MSELITKESVLNTEHTQLAAELTDWTRAQLPSEKSRAEREMEQTAKDVADGLAPTSGEGRGQAMLSVPLIVHTRWQQEYPGCWQDKQFCEEFAFDNPRCCLPGFKPRAKKLYFDMKHGNRKLNNPGGDIYHDKRAKVNALIAADYKAQNMIPAPGI